RDEWGRVAIGVAVLYAAAARSLRRDGGVVGDHVLRAVCGDGAAQAQRHAAVRAVRALSLLVHRRDGWAWRVADGCRVDGSAAHHHRPLVGRGRGVAAQAGRRVGSQIGRRLRASASFHAIIPASALANAKPAVLTSRGASRQRMPSIPTPTPSIPTTSIPTPTGPVVASNIKPMPANGSAA